MQTKMNGHSTIVSWFLFYFVHNIVFVQSMLPINPDFAVATPWIPCRCRMEVFSASSISAERNNGASGEDDLPSETEDSVTKYL